MPWRIVQDYRILPNPKCLKKRIVLVTNTNWWIGESNDSHEINIHKVASRDLVQKEIYYQIVCVKAWSPVEE